MTRHYRSRPEAELRRRPLAATVVVTVLCGLGGCAAREHLVRGTIVAVDQGTLAVRHKSGQIVPFALNPTTTFKWDRQTLSRGDVAVGARVMVYFDEPRAPFVAREVRVFTSPPAARRPPWQPASTRSAPKR